MQTFTHLTDARMGQVSRIGDQSTTNQTVSGRNIFNGLGRQFFTIKFPVVFCGRPTYSSGGELDPQTPYVALGMPIPPECTSLVAAWDYYGDVSGAWEGYFTGATILAIIRGAKEQVTWVNWTFQGPALTNPVKGEDTVSLI